MNQSQVQNKYYLKLKKLLLLLIKHGIIVEYSLSFKNGKKLIYETRKPRKN